MRPRWQIFVAALCCSAARLAAEQQDFGSGGSAAWSLANGTRALVLGSAAGLMAEDSSVLVNNPAAMAWMEHGEAGFHHGFWESSVSWDQVSAVLPLGPGKALGLAGALANYGSFDRLDDSGQNVGSYGASEALGAAGYGQRFGNVALGGSAFLTRQTIDQDALYGAAWSAGALWRLWQALALGIGARSSTDTAARLWEGDLGAAFSTSAEAASAWGLGLNARASGGSVPELQSALTRGFQAGSTRGQLLAGYRLEFGGAKEQGALAGWTLGASLNWSALAFDYAFVPMGDLEASQHFGLRYSFGGSGSM